MAFSMTREFRADGQPLPSKPPRFPYKPPANSPPRRKPGSRKPVTLAVSDKVVKSEPV